MPSLINKELFARTINLLAARLPSSSVNPVRQLIKETTKAQEEVIFTMPRVKSVHHDSGNPAKRLLLLAEAIKVYSDIPSSALRLFEEHQAEFVPFELKVGYEYLTGEEVLRQLLPEGVDVPGSFETVGHIAHLNLREEHQPYKRLIGQVILEKSPCISVVVNKVGTIDSTFRFFAMEILASSHDESSDSNPMEVEVREEGCRFAFDYSKVYWNSRLQAEHKRLVALFTPGQRICDVFCGVGPFALPSAKKGCQVWANDLNPESIKWLTYNSSLNKIAKGSLHIHNMDGRQFMRKALDAVQEGFDHYVMNLPAIAYQFLDTISELLDEGKIPRAARVHCYTFVKPDGSALANVEEGLGRSVHAESTQVYLVRTVAPNKDMYCVSFTIPVPGKRTKIDVDQDI